MQNAIVYHRKIEIAMTDIANIRRAKRLFGLLGLVNEGIFMVKQEWRITAFNAAAERITLISCELDFYAYQVDQSCCSLPLRLNPLDYPLH